MSYKRVYIATEGFDIEKYRLFIDSLSKIRQDHKYDNVAVVFELDEATKNKMIESWEKVDFKLHDELWSKSDYLERLKDCSQIVLFEKEDVPYAFIDANNMFNITYLFQITDGNKLLNLKDKS